jgi:hypothetical protein
LIWTTTPPTGNGATPSALAIPDGEDLVVDVADPRALTNGRARPLCWQLLCTANMAIYRSPVVAEDKAIPRLLAAQMGLHRLDGNWLADEDGISPIAVAQRRAVIAQRSSPTPTAPSSGIPTVTTIRAQRQIRAMVLHCVRAASEGGGTALMDHEMAYIALREANPNWVNALMAPDAMTIPARTGRRRSRTGRADRPRFFD